MHICEMEEDVSESNHDTYINGPKRSFERALERDNNEWIIGIMIVVVLCLVYEDDGDGDGDGDALLCNNFLKRTARMNK